MDVDPDIANWVLEFLLRLPLEEGMLKSLLWILPPRDNSPNLKKLLLLKKLELEVSNDTISEETLGLLEQLGELELQKGCEGLSDAMKRAYCAVAVECTVKTLSNSDFRDRFHMLNYMEAVKRVWRGRIGGMEKVDERWGLGSEDLWAWKKEAEDAVLDNDVYEKITKKSKRVNAAEAIVNFVKEEREKMGPSFLELVAARKKGGKSMQGLLGAGSVDQVTGNEEPSHGTDLTEDHDNQVEIRKGNIRLRNKLVGVRRRSRRLAIGDSEGAKIVDTDEMETMPSSRNYNVPHSTEVNRVQKSVKLNEMDLHAVVKDPFPKTSKLAEAVVDNACKNELHDPVEDNCVEANVVDDAGVDQSIRCDVTRDHQHINPLAGNGVKTNAMDSARADKTIDSDMSNTPPRPHLLERNFTAHTNEWEDSIGRYQQDPTYQQGTLLLPCPVRLNDSSVQWYANYPSGRKKRQLWSSLEENTLREGVKKYGVGNWKCILTAYRQTFETRNEVDLKDKWRNLTRQRTQLKI